MNIQCEACREIVAIGSFRSSSDGIHVSCSACAETFFVPAGPTDVPDETRSEPTAEPAAGEMRCSKCDAVQLQARACCVCGLQADRFDDYTAAAADPVHATSAELQELWKRCQDNWLAPESHTTFLEAASTERAYSFAALCYRSAQADGEAGEVARAQLERLSKMAEIALLGALPAREGESRGPEPYKNVLILLIALLLIGGGLGMYALLKTNAKASDDGSLQVPKASPTKLRTR